MGPPFVPQVSVRPPRFWTVSHLDAGIEEQLAKGGEDDRGVHAGSTAELASAIGESIAHVIDGGTGFGIGFHANTWVGWAGDRRAAREALSNGAPIRNRRGTGRGRRTGCGSPGPRRIGPWRRSPGACASTHAGSTDGTPGCNHRPAGRDRELRFLGGVDSTPAAIERPVRKLEKRCRRLSFVYVSHLHSLSKRLKRIRAILGHRQFRYAARFKTT